MKTIQIGELKTHFSEILNKVKNGDEIIISYGRKKEKIAKIVPYKNSSTAKKRKLGIFKDKGNYIIKNDFEMTEEEFINL
ncbi:MAG: type II toxin-antitoxin system prevent-host-death family antitoxin [Spirochaetes bacterium]|nr:type II toxin-antitoxin system prevent-host-death family antitoxin [Spirochaetota bacterium]